MRTRFLFFTVMVSLFLLSSCEFEEKDFGYPKSVWFPSEGGTKILQGDNHISHFEIEPYGFSQVINDTVMMTYEWLTIKSKVGSTILIMEAMPSESTKKRKLTVYGYNTDKFTRIDVTQAGQ